LACFVVWGGVEGVGYYVEARGGGVLCACGWHVEAGAASVTVESNANTASTLQYNIHLTKTPTSTSTLTPNRSGVMEMATCMVEARRRKQGGNGSSGFRVSSEQLQNRAALKN